MVKEAHKINGESMLHASPAVQLSYPEAPLIPDDVSVPHATAQSDGLSQELETLLALLRQSPPASLVGPTVDVGSASVENAHDKMLAALIAGATTRVMPTAQARDIRPPFHDVQPRIEFAPPQVAAPVGHMSHTTADTQADAKLPATWYSPPEDPPEPWFGSELRAGALGLGLGVMIIAPVIMLTGGWFQTDRKPSPSQGVAKTRTDKAATERPEALVSTLAESKIEIAAVRRESIAGAAPTATETSLHPALSEAQKLIELGDIEAAREKLLDPALAAKPQAQFALAETFDPNVLAAWGTRGINADPERARTHYSVALGLGWSAARERLKGLQ